MSIWFHARNNVLRNGPQDDVFILVQLAELCYPSTHLFVSMCRHARNVPGNVSRWTQSPNIAEGHTIVCRKIRGLGCVTHTLAGVRFTQPSQQIFLQFCRWFHSLAPVGKAGNHLFLVKFEGRFNLPMRDVDKPGLSQDIHHISVSQFLVCSCFLAVAGCACRQEQDDDTEVCGYSDSV